MFTFASFPFFAASKNTKKEDNHLDIRDNNNIW